MSLTLLAPPGQEGHCSYTHAHSEYACYTWSRDLLNSTGIINTLFDNKFHELIAVKLLHTYHCGRLQSTPFGKLCADASA
jgi:hypothetical protein